MKTFSPAAIQALKEALTHIYWKRKDLRSFVYHSISNKSIVSTIDWASNLKNESASQLVDRMTARLDIFNDDLMSLFDAVMHFNDFSHLEYLEDSSTKIEKAKRSVIALRNHASGYFTLKEESERASQRKQAFDKLHSERLSFQQQIATLRDLFFKITAEKNHQKRGYLLEPFLNDLFTHFDLDPKEPFKITGEQIDGAFTFEYQDYLLEAKWQDKPIQAADLYNFGGKISGKLKVVLGLYIAINGFSAESTRTEASIVKSMILMDGGDIMAVLEGRITLNELLYRKRRHASERGEIYFPFTQF